MAKDFTQISNSIIKDTSLSDGAFRTYILLKSYKFTSNEIFPAQLTLAMLRGVTRETISHHIKELLDKKYIKRKKRGFSKTNSYLLIRETSFTISNDISEDYFTNEGKSTSQIKCNNLHANNTKGKNTKNNNTHLLSGFPAESKQKDVGLTIKKFNEMREALSPKLPMLKIKKKEGGR